MNGLRWGSTTKCYENMATRERIQENGSELSALVFTDRFFFLIIFIHQLFKNYLSNNSNFLQYCMLNLYFWISERNLLEMHSGIFFLPFYTLVIIRVNQLNFIIMQNFILSLSFFIFIIIFILSFYLI